MIPNAIIPPLCETDLLLCDFDGTISIHDTGLLVAERLGLEEFLAIEHRWRAGVISSRECLREQWRIIDPSRRDFQELIRNLEISPGFEDLARLAEGRGARFVILSDGLDYYIELTLQRLNLAYLEYRANHAVLHEHSIEMQFPYDGGGCEFCGNCKTRWLFELRPGLQRTIYIGDGLSDACASRFCELVFAKDLLAKACQERGQRYVPFDTLRDVVQVLRGDTR